MINIACYLLLFVTATGVVYADGTTALTAEVIAQKSIQDLHSLQNQLNTAIDAEIGRAKCAEDKQCKALAIGANPCGGPETYKAYSVIDTNIQRLTDLAAQYKTVRKTLHAKTGTMGACVVVPEPALQCKSQQCVTMQQPGASVF